MSKHVSLGNFIHPCKKFELWFQNSKGQMSIFLSPRGLWAALENFKSLDSSTFISQQFEVYSKLRILREQ